MGYLTVKRQKQSGKGLQGFLKVTIDETQILEISNGETKMINVDSMNPVEKLIDKFPDIVDSVTAIFKK